VADTLRDLSDRLSLLLTDLDIALRVRLREAEKQAARQRPESAAGDTRVRRVVAAAFRWLRHPAREELESRPARSAHARRSGR